MNEYAARLVRGYRSRGVLVDTNLLLLLFVGSYDLERIERFKRTMQFTRDDFARLVALLGVFERRVTTPHILTEVSNLAGHLPTESRLAFAAVYRELLMRLFEIRDTSSRGPHSSGMA